MTVETQKVGWSTQQWGDPHPVEPGDLGQLWRDVDVAGEDAAVAEQCGQQRGSFADGTSILGGKAVASLSGR